MNIKPEVAIALVVLLVLWSKGNEPTPHNPNVSSGAQHPANRTPMTSTEFRTVLRAAFEAAMGRAPTPHEEAMLLAHSAAETRRWKAMYGFNAGFVTTDGGLDWFAGSEIDPGNPLKFRWYPSAELGVKDWLYVLRSDFPGAWEHLGDDPVQYVDGLFHGKHGSYFGGPEVLPSYQRLVNALFNEFSAWTDVEPAKALARGSRGQQGAVSQGPLPFTRRRVARRKKKR